MKKEHKVVSKEEFISYLTENNEKQASITVQSWEKLVQSNKQTKLKKW